MLSREGFRAPLHRGPRRWALNQIIRNRCRRPEIVEQALDIIGEGRSGPIDLNALRKLEHDISAKRPTYQALLDVTPWRAPDGLYEAWEFAEDKIPTTLPIHLVLTLLLDLRERTVAALKWIEKIREALPDDYERKDNPPTFIKKLKEIEQYVDGTIALIFNEATAAKLKQGFSPALKDFEAARIAQRDADMILRSWLRSRPWTILGVQQQFHNAEQASLTAAVGAAVTIVRAATGKPHASQIGQLISIATANDSFCAKDAVLNAERSSRQARASAPKTKRDAL